MKTLLIRALPLFMVVPLTHAQNDECSGAIAIGVGVTPFNTGGATTSAPAWPCAPGGSDLWYSYTAGAVSEIVSVDTCTGVTNYDTTLEVFAGACGALTSIGCNDDFCFPQSTVTWTASAGTRYLFRVGGFASSTGSGELNLVATPMPIGQDNCAAALDTITGDGSWDIDNGGATTGSEGQNEANCYKFGDAGIQSDVWLLWESTTNGPVTMDTCAAGGSNGDTKMAAYPSGGCPTDGSSLACNDDTCSLRSQITINACCGDSYMIQVGSFPGSGDGTFTLTVNQSGVLCDTTDWTQSVDNSTLFPGTGIACAEGAGTGANSWLRLYDPITQGVMGDFEVTDVTFGVVLAEELTNGFTAITVNVRDGSNFGLFANMPVIATANVNVPDTDASMQTFVTVPMVGASFAAGTPVVLEIFAPAGAADASSFFVGGNDLGQSGPTFFAAADCGSGEPVDLAQVGFPDIHLIIDAVVNEDDPVIGCNYCGPAVPNSSGVGAKIEARGSDVAGGNPLTLHAYDMPTGNFGYFIGSPNANYFTHPLTSGYVCVNNPLSRWNGPGQVRNTGSTGTFDLDIDTLAIPSGAGTPFPILSGETFRFQAWFRDGATNNLTDGVEILFQ